MKKIILILATLLLTGCYDYNELTDLGIVSSMFIDYKDNEYSVNIEILNTNSKVQEPSYFLSATGDTFNSALNNLYTKTNKEIYLNHLSTVILSESFAKDKMNEIYDYFVRAPYIRKDLIFFITEDIDGFIKGKTKDNMALGEALINTLEYSYKDYGYYKTSDFETILNSYLNDKTYVLGKIAFEDETINLTDTYLISNNKLNFKVDKNAVLLSNILDKKVTSFTLSSSNTFEIYAYKVQKNIQKNKITLNIDFDVRLKNIDNTLIDSKEEKKKQEKMLNNYFSKLFLNSINYSITMDEDIYNINYYYYLKYPKLLKNNTFKEINYEISVNTNINEKGLLIGTKND